MNGNQKANRENNAFFACNHFPQQIINRIIGLVTAFAFLPLFASATALEISLEPSDNVYFPSTYLVTDKDRTSTDKWLPAVSLSTSSTDYLQLNNNGELYFLSQGIESKKVLSISELASNQATESQGNNGFISASALAIHPGYSLRDQTHSGKFYLAHSEQAQPGKRNRKLNSHVDSDDMAYDLIITEWKMSVLDPSRIQPDSAREVLRLAVPSTNYRISQLKFDPFSRSWDQDYGLLHIGISAPNNKEQHATFSGAILRIQPDSFGVKTYTVPSTNPFVKSKDINAEVVAYGLGQVHDIVWSKTLHNKVLVDHSLNNSEQLSIVQWGEDWHELHQRSTLWQAQPNEVISERFSYSGANLPKLRNQLIFLKRSASSWQLLSMPLTTKANGVSSDIKPIELSFSDGLAEQLSENCSLVESASHELLLVDQENEQAYTLTSLVTASVDSSASQSNAIVAAANTAQTGNDSTATPEAEQGSTTSSVLLVLMVVLAVTGFAFYGYRKKKKHGQFPLLRTQYARFELSEDSKVLKLYARHGKTVAAELQIADIAQSELSLNKEVVSTVSRHTEHTFTPEREQQLLQHFAKESRLKMVDDKVRQVSLALVDKHKHKVAICLYYRKGNQRLTRARYSAVLEQIIDWQWFISARVNDKTPVRPEPLVTQKKPSPANNTASSAHTPVQNTQIKSDSLIDESQLVDDSEHIEEELPDAAVEVTAQEDAELTAAAGDNHQDILADAIEATISEQAAKQQAVQNSDSEIIFAIDKLVNLKHAGHITEHQFEVAKAKLLQDLVND